MHRFIFQKQIHNNHIELRWQNIIHCLQYRIVIVTRKKQFLNIEMVTQNKYAIAIQNTLLQYTQWYVQCTHIRAIHNNDYNTQNQCAMHTWINATITLLHYRKNYNIRVIYTWNCDRTSYWHICCQLRYDNIIVIHSYCWNI